MTIFHAILVNQNDVLWVNKFHNFFSIVMGRKTMPIYSNKVLELHIELCDDGLWFSADCINIFHCFKQDLRKIWFYDFISQHCEVQRAAGHCQVSGEVQVRICFVALLFCFRWQDQAAAGISFLGFEPKFITSSKQHLLRRRRLRFEFMILCKDCHGRGCH